MKQFCRLVKTHTFLTCLVLAAVLLASIIIGIGTGPVAIPFAEVWRVMFHRLGGLLTGSELPLEGVRESTQNTGSCGPRGCCWGPWWGRPSPFPAWGCRHSPRIRWPSPMCWAFPPAHH